MLVPGYDSKPKNIFKIDTTIAAMPLFWGLTAEVNLFARVDAYAGIGPFVLRDLVADGTYSTKQNTGSQVSLRGVLHASGEAGMTAKAGVEAAVEIG